MAVLYFYNPYDASSRQTLINLQKQNADVQVIHRMSPADDMTFHISFLPTALAHDDQGNEVDRIEHPGHMSLANINWLHQAVVDKKAGKDPGPPPWKQTPPGPGNSGNTPPVTFTLGGS